MFAEIPLSQAIERVANAYFRGDVAAAGDAVLARLKSGEIYATGCEVRTGNGCRGPIMPLAYALSRYDTDRPDQLFDLIFGEPGWREVWVRHSHLTRIWPDIEVRAESGPVSFRELVSFYANLPRNLSHIGRDQRARQHFKDRWIPKSVAQEAVTALHRPMGRQRKESGYRESL
jgi:hypothetical protein